METFIIYDESGKIILTQAGGGYPSAVKHLTVNVPEGKQVTAVDPVSGEVTLGDIPKTEEQKRLDALEAEQQSTSQAVLGLMDMLNASMI